MSKKATNVGLDSRTTASMRTCHLTWMMFPLCVFACCASAARSLQTAIVAFLPADPIAFLALCIAATAFMLKLAHADALRSRTPNKAQLR